MEGWFEVGGVEVGTISRQRSTGTGRAADRAGIMAEAGILLVAARRTALTARMLAQSLASRVTTHCMLWQWWFPRRGSN